MICKECRHPWELHRNGVGCLVEGCPCGVDADESAHAWERPMTDNTEREALAKLIYGAIAFHGGDPEHYEAMRDGIYHDAADAILAEFLPDHDKRVRAEQREQIVTMIDASPAVTWTGKGGVRERIAAIREASDD